MNFIIFKINYSTNFLIKMQLFTTILFYLNMKTFGKFESRIYELFQQIVDFKFALGGEYNFKYISKNNIKENSNLSLCFQLPCVLLNPTSYVCYIRKCYLTNMMLAWVCWNVHIHGICIAVYVHLIHYLAVALHCVQVRLRNCPALSSLLQIRTYLRLLIKLCT